MHVRSRDGVWEAVCWYYDGTKRKRVRRSTGVKDDGSARSKRTAEINAAEIERSLALGLNRRVRAETLAQAFDALITKKQQAGRSEATIEITLEKAKNVLEHFGPSCLATSVDDQSLQSYAIQNAKRAPASLYREILELRQAIKALGLPVPKAPTLSSGESRERWLPPDEFAKLIRHVRPERHDHLFMYRLAALSKSDLYKIDPSKGDLDFEANAFRVRGSKSKYRDRWLPMHPVVREILERRQDMRPMFESWGNVYRELATAARNCKIERFDLNALRRSFATELALAGRSPLQLKPLMGHSPNSRVLDKHYARLQGRQLGSVVDGLATYKRRVTCVPETMDAAHTKDVRDEWRASNPP